MIGLTLGVKVYLCTIPADMRRGFDGLSGMAESLMQQDPLSGHKPNNEQLHQLLPDQWLIANPDKRWEIAEIRKNERNKT